MQNHRQYTIFSIHLLIGIPCLRIRIAKMKTIASVKKCNAFFAAYPEWIVTRIGIWQDMAHRSTALAVVFAMFHSSCWFMQLWYLSLALRVTLSCMQWFDIRTRQSVWGFATCLGIGHNNLTFQRSFSLQWNIEDFAYVQVSQKLTSGTQQ